MTKVVEQSCNILLDFEHDNPACTFWVNLNKKNSFSAEQLKKINQETNMTSHCSDCYKQESLKHCSSK